jgi:hypothetical protein
LPTAQTNQRPTILNSCAWTLARIPISQCFSLLLSLNVHYIVPCGALILPILPRHSHILSQYSLIYLITKPVTYLSNIYFIEFLKANSSFGKSYSIYDISYIKIPFYFRHPWPIKSLNYELSIISYDNLSPPCLSHYQLYFLS